jgi:hypothetical protein
MPMPIQIPVRGEDLAQFERFLQQLLSQQQENAPAQQPNALEAFLRLQQLLSQQQENAPAQPPNALEAFLQEAFNPQNQDRQEDRTPVEIIGDEMPAISDEEEPHVEQLSDGIKELFKCPILQDTMMQPYLTSDGQSYNLPGIRQWLSTNKTSPAQGGDLPDKKLVPNRALKAILEAIITKKKDITAEGGGAGQEDQAAITLDNLLGDETRAIMTCPLSGELMSDPVTTPKGMTYQRSSLTQYLQSNENQNPCRGEPGDDHAPWSTVHWRTTQGPTSKLQIEACIPNISLRNLVAEQIRLDSERAPVAAEATTCCSIQ